MAEAIVSVERFAYKFTPPIENPRTFAVECPSLTLAKVIAIISPVCREVKMTDFSLLINLLRRIVKMSQFDPRLQLLPSQLIRDEIGKDPFLQIV